MKMSRITPIALLTVLFLLGGCAASSTEGGKPRRNSELLTADEIAESGVQTVHDAVSRLRPRWLSVRSARNIDGVSGEIFVFLNGSLLGDPEAMRNLNANTVYALRYMDGSTAQSTLPGLTARHVEGAILIYTSEDAMRY